MNGTQQTEGGDGREPWAYDFEDMMRRQPMVREYNQVTYKPMNAEAFEILPPLERAKQVEWLADHRRMGAALAIANLVEVDLTPRPDEIDTFRRLSYEWRQAHERRQELEKAETSEVER